MIKLSEVLNQPYSALKGCELVSDGHGRQKHTTYTPLTGLRDLSAQRHTVLLLYGVS